MKVISYKELNTKTGTHGVEELLHMCVQGSEVNLFLPRNSRHIFFKETWMFLLILTLSRRCRLTVTDYAEPAGSKEVGELIDQLWSVPAGITALYLADTVNAKNGTIVNLPKSEIVHHLGSPFSKKKFTSGGRLQCFSVDPEFSDPTHFRALNKIRGSFVSSEWKNTLRGMLEKELSIHLPRGGIYDSMLDAVFEIFENTKKHGRFSCNRHSKEMELIEGVRYFSVKKHMAVSSEQITYRSTEFEELGLFLDELPKKTTRKYLEVCVSDMGEGIAAWYKRSGMDTQLEGKSDTEVVNHIVQENRSSDKLSQGAGKGLEIIVNAVKDMNGFLSVRCNSSWTYFYSTYKIKKTERIEGKDIQFRDVKLPRPPAEVVGTHFNILIPIEEEHWAPVVRRKKRSTTVE